MLSISYQTLSSPLKTYLDQLSLHVRTVTFPPLFSPLPQLFQWSCRESRLARVCLHLSSQRRRNFTSAASDLFTTTVTLQLVRTKQVSGLARQNVKTSRLQSRARVQRSSSGHRLVSVNMVCSFLTVLNPLMVSTNSSSSINCEGEEQSVLNGGYRTPEHKTLWSVLACLNGSFCIWVNVQVC